MTKAIVLKQDSGKYGGQVQPILEVFQIQVKEMVGTPGFGLLPTTL